VVTKAVTKFFFAESTIRERGGKGSLACTDPCVYASWHW
jgi:hypothetical protein